MQRTAFLLLSLLVLVGSPVPVRGDDCTGAAAGDPCDDGIFCNGPDLCGQVGAAWGCLFHSGNPCLDGAECANFCNEAADNCFNPQDTPCTEDGEVCTDDACDGNGLCAHPPKDGQCDDGIFCNGDDTCDGGTCAAHTGDPCADRPECENTCNEEAENCFTAFFTPCTDDGNACTDNVCNGVGVCLASPNSDPCDDGLFCTGNDRCAGGACSGDPAEGPCVDGPQCANTCNENGDSCLVALGTPCKNDGNLCTDDECDGSGACAHTPNADPCDDGIFCNGDDRCEGGACSVHTGDPCVDGPECANTCNENDDNCFLPLGTSCEDDGNACTDDRCNGLGACARLPNDEPCDDGLYCNGDDQCSGGSCGLHTGDPCGGGLECALMCDEEGDACAIPLGTVCSSDGNPCTDDVCLAGECTHSTIPGCQVCAGDADCDDANPCTLDTCAVDGCDNPPILDCLPCAVDGDCEDGDACTVDSCGPENRCNNIDTACFTRASCPFFSGLAMGTCAGERIPRTISRLIDRAGCKVEQAEKRAAAGRRRVAKKLNIAQRSLTKATGRVNKVQGKKLSAPCAAALLGEIGDRSNRIGSLMDQANGGSQLAACTDGLVNGVLAPTQPPGPSLCGKR